MLLFVESSAFPFRTFVVRVQPLETIARVRAHLLHILYEVGHDDPQFRLRFNGVYLRDAYTIDDYEIMENAILKMVPLSKDNSEVVQSLADVQSVASGTLSGSDSVTTLPPDVKEALAMEIKKFKQREKIIRDFKGLLYLHFLGTFFGFLTYYWYSGFWTGFLWALGVIFCPTFTRSGGYIGMYSIYKKWFCIGYGVLSLAITAVSIYLGTTEWRRVVNHGCTGWVFVGHCSHQHVFSAFYFVIQPLILLVSSGLVWVLLWNMKVEVGDYIEKFLVQTRDIELVMKAACKGRVKERRIAAFELATLAASGDDNKFRIVAEGGLEVLLRMALSADVATQEHAVEAIAELLTIPAIQDSVVDMGGVRTLTALLHSPEPRLVHEAAVALSYIVSDSEDNKGAVVNDHGLSDLCHAAQTGAVDCQRIIAGIFLELAFNANIRSQMAALNSPAEALIHLSQSADPETQRFALQTLELLSIESSDMICTQEDLLRLLLELPTRTVDERIYLLAGKILLYFAENRQTCEEMLDFPGVRESLALYARSADPILQKVIVKVIFYTLEAPELKCRAQHLELDCVLKDIRENASDREAWDMADQALQFMFSDDDMGTLHLQTLPQLSTSEKLDRMSKQFGSKSSLVSSTSIGKPTASFNDSTGNVQKGIN